MATFKTTDLNEFKDRLHNEVVDFEFIKKDGTLRKAKGTLVAKHLPPQKEGTTSKKPSVNVCVYYDMEKNEFRSFVKESFVGAY